VHFNGAYGDKLLPETMGGGTAFFDYDNDGDQDLLFVNSSTWPHRPPAKPKPTMALYRNNGAGQFDNVTQQVGLDVSFYGMGVAIADYDGNGWPDIFFTAVGKNHLFHNQKGRFTEVTDQAGVAGRDQEWSTSAGFFDYDNDGDLDLFVTNYVRWTKEIDQKLDFRLTGVGRAFGPPQNYEGTFPYLYRNNGDGTFVDVSDESGIKVQNAATGLPEAKSLALAIIDADQDGWSDVFIANDTVKNYFFHNQRDGTFDEVGEIYGLAYGPDGNATGAMGVDVAHFRNDQNLGFMIGNFANEMTSVYVSQDDPSFFVDDAIGAGIGATSRRALTFGLFLFDYDLDGRLDMLQANGHIENEINKMDPSQTFEQAAQLFWNAGPNQTTGFISVDSTGDLTQKIVGRGASYADVDADGDLDVVLTQIGGSPLLLRNDQKLKHHWLRVKLEGHLPNQHAIGAWVELKTQGQMQRRQVMPTRSYLSQVELPITFGLGAATDVFSLQVIWPNGEKQMVAVSEIDCEVLVKQAN
jgi:enediyne biosynthesis protein E4